MRTPASAPVDGATSRRRGGVWPHGLLLIGLFAPTSLAGQIRLELVVAQAVVATLWFTWLGVFRHRLGSPLQVWCAAAVMVCPLFFTVLSPFEKIAPGALTFFVSMAALLAMDFSDADPPLAPARALAAASTVVLLVGAGVVAGVQPVQDLLVANYSAAYPDLVANMMTFRKPVFTFGSHSIAAFFYYLLFLLHLETYRATRSRLHLALAALLCLEGFLLTSLSAGVLMAAASLQLLRARGGRWWLDGGLLAVAVTLVAARFRDVVADLDVLGRLAFAATDSGGGLIGRFGAEGNLVANLDYLRLHPLRPIGVTYAPQLFFGDSGWVEYVLRGSLPLLLAVYGGLALFLWRNVRAARHRWHLFGLVVIFEIGYTILTYPRTLFLLPLAVTYLNGLDPAGAARADRT